jgi:hypothetical protein
MNKPMARVKTAETNTPEVWARSIRHDARAWKRLKKASGLTDNKLEDTLIELVKIAEDDGAYFHGLE